MILVPMSADDVTLVQWADFQIENIKFVETNGFDELLEAVKVFYKDSDLTGLPVGDFSDDITLGAEPTLFGLYAHITRLIASYQPEPIEMPFRYVWQDEEYVISAADTALIAGLRPITVGESVTLLELTRHCGEGIEDMYNLTIAHLAILLRKPNEALPLGLGDRERFISVRKQLWAEASMSLGLQVQGYFNALVATILGRFPTGNSKPSKESQELWDKSGWNSIIANSPLGIKEANEQSLEDALFKISHKTF